VLRAKQTAACCATGARQAVCTESGPVIKHGRGQHISQYAARFSYTNDRRPSSSPGKANLRLSAFCVPASSMLASILTPPQPSQRPPPPPGFRSLLHKAHELHSNTLQFELRTTWPSTLTWCKILPDPQNRSCGAASASAPLGLLAQPPPACRESLQNC